MDVLQYFTDLSLSNTCRFQESVATADSGSQDCGAQHEPGWLSAISYDLCKLSEAAWLLQPCSDEAQAQPGCSGGPALFPPLLVHQSRPSRVQTYILFTQHATIRHLTVTLNQCCYLWCCSFQHNSSIWKYGCFKFSPIKHFIKRLQAYKFLMWHIILLGS